MGKTAVARMSRSGILVAAVVASTSLSGCFWSGFREPTELTMAGTGPRPPCPRIGTQNLSARDAATIVEAGTTVCRLFRSERFREELSRQGLRERCDDERRIDGSELHRLLLSALPDYSVIAKKPLRSEAVTLARSQRMAIDPGRFEAWRAGGDQRGWMVNTLAHELTHLIPAEDGSRFQDEGHGEAGCPDAELVSYRVGELAESLWSETGPD